MPAADGAPGAGLDLLEERLDVPEEEESLLATRDPSRRGRIQHERSAFDFGLQCRDARMACCERRAIERRARGLSPDASHRDSSDHQLVGGPRCSGKERGVEIGERALGRVHMPGEEKSPSLEVPRVCGVHVIAVSLEEATAQLKTVPDDWYEVGRAFFG